MMSEQHEPSETSSLLIKPAGVLPEAVHAPIGPLPYGTEANRNGKPGNDGERQQEEDQMPYQGMPDVKRRMKYILPAIGIGVCGER